MKTTLEELQVLIAIVDAGSLTAAAAAGITGQTVSAISRTLTRLERKLGMTLLERTTRRWSLTQEGHYFVEKAREVIALLSQAEENVRLADRTPEGRLRISAPFPFIKHVILPLLPAFQQRYPKIITELNTDDLIVDLLENQVDVAIRIADLKDSTLYARLLMRSPLHIVASPSYLQQRGTPLQPEALQYHTLLGFSKNPNLNDWPLNEQKRKISVTPHVLASSGEIIRELTLAGQGIACLADYMISDDLRTGRLVNVLTPHTTRRSQSIYAVYYKQNHLAARVKCFIDFLAETLPL